MADVFAGHGASFLDLFGNTLSPQQWQAYRSILGCRTPALGGHKHSCASCGQDHLVFHSCNHRLCPECGGQKTKDWLQKQEENLLPVPYFLVTFTVPHGLHAFFKRREAFWYEALFACSSAALMELARERKTLEGQAAFLGVLHTWRRDLAYHPHVHYIMPGGVLGEDSNGKPCWRQVKKHKGKDYLCPVRELSVRMRMAMEDYVREHEPELFALVPPRVWRAEWVTHVQPAGNGKNTLRYLARYVTKSALGKERILADDGRGVTFNYFPKGGQKPEVITLPAHAFIRRVLQHALPKGFKRVRYYGWLHPAAKKRLMLVQNLLQVPLRMNRGQEEKSAKPERTCRGCGGTAFLAPVRVKPMRLSLGELLELCRKRPGVSPPAQGSKSSPSRGPPGVKPEG